MILIDIASWLLILAGCFFILVGALGMMRLPELFARMHAASLIDTLGIGFLFAGLMLQAGFTQVTLKLLFILLLFFFTGPVITHALAQAAMEAGIKPELAEDRRGRLDESGKPVNSDSEGRPS
ncbi:MAG TPA: monovalent cation/H(+) antiporter subunit G [Hyphomicrobiaceae bacterium]|nr:monovalent cation/H(+) antiporter subunit G [Hyphomicrobiaceae bacterium]